MAVKQFLATIEIDIEA
jgi:hypothetical protein